MKPYALEDGAIRLAVRLTPRARKDEIGDVLEVGDDKAALAIRLTAAPVDGAANAALIAFLAQALDVSKSSVRITSGEKSRLKIVRLAGVAAADLDRLIEG